MTTIKRIEGWEDQLGQFIFSRLKTPLVWGEADCALTACDAVKKMTGVDIAYFFRGEYNSPETADARLKEFSGGGLRETMQKLAGEFELEEINKYFAQRGDLVLASAHVEIGGVRDVLGVIDASGRIAVAGKNGLKFLPIEKAEIVWKI